MRASAVAPAAGEAKEAPPRDAAHIRTLAEHAGKAALAAFGVSIRDRALSLRARLRARREKLVSLLSSRRRAHTSSTSRKSALSSWNVRNDADAEAAAQRLSKLSDSLLVEEMVADGVAEILVGMTVDPQFGQVLVIGAGGVLTELLRDSVTLLPPFTVESIEAAINDSRLRSCWLGSGASPPAMFPLLISTVLACTRYAEANLNALLELDINPVSFDRQVAVP